MSLLQKYERQIISCVFEAEPMVDWYIDSFINRWSEAKANGFISNDNAVFKFKTPFKIKVPGELDKEVDRIAIIGKSNYYVFKFSLFYTGSTNYTSVILAIKD